MSLLKQCKFCKKLFTGSECEDCKFKRKLEIITIEIALYFETDHDKFFRFIIKYFYPFDDYTKIHTSGNDSVYFKAILTIYYYYMNMSNYKFISKKNVRGFIAKKGYYYDDMDKYFSQSKELLLKRYNRFNPNRVRRIEKLKNSIKSMLGKLKRPIWSNHVISLIELLNYDDNSIKIDRLALLYIMFYMEQVRGIPLNRSKLNEIKERTGMSNSWYYRNYKDKFIDTAKESLNENFDKEELSEKIKGEL